MTTRRGFLVDCSLLTTAAMLTPAALLAGYGSGAEVAPNLPGLTAFAAEVGTDFLVSAAAGPGVQLRLVRARPLPTADPASAEHRFSLLFDGPGELPLKQGTHAMKHPRLGLQDVFIVPVLRCDGFRQCYEAIFDRCPEAVV